MHGEVEIKFKPYTCKFQPQISTVFMDRSITDFKLISRIDIFVVNLTNKRLETDSNVTIKMDIMNIIIYICCRKL